MIRRCLHCGLPNPESTTCAYCGCTEHVHDALSPTVALSIVTGAFAACAAGLAVTACSGQGVYEAPGGPVHYYYDAATDADAADAEAEASTDAGDSDAADAAPE
jgi:hypothetical protein